MRVALAQGTQLPAGRPIGILGGTFDPVHLGHLRSAFEVLHACLLGEVRFIPCGVPAHRPPPVAPAALRSAMLKAAVAGEPGFLVDERELQRPGLSFTFDTLASLRAEVGSTPLCLILGSDAFLGLADWHRWAELPDLAHFILMQRPGSPMPQDRLLQQFLAARRAAGVDELANAPSGRIWVQPVSQLDVSSSAIRALVMAGGDPKYLVPDSVRSMIAGSRCFISAAARAAGSTEVQVRA